MFVVLRDNYLPQSDYTRRATAANKYQGNLLEKLVGGQNLVLKCMSAITKTKNAGVARDNARQIPRLIDRTNRLAYS